MVCFPGNEAAWPIVNKKRHSQLPENEKDATGVYTSVS